MLYKDGIFVDETCGNERMNLDHGVLLVGYGTDNSSVPTDANDFWIVKNRFT